MAGGSPAASDKAVKEEPPAEQQSTSGAATAVQGKAQALTDIKEEWLND